MGPISVLWIQEHGEGWSGGRIDIRDDTKHGYDGWNEYSLPPMRTEDWKALDEWLWNLTTNELYRMMNLLNNLKNTMEKR